jgi:hypothetical protein
MKNPEYSAFGKGFLIAAAMGAALTGLLGWQQGRTISSAMLQLKSDQKQFAADAAALKTGTAALEVCQEQRDRATAAITPLASAQTLLLAETGPGPSAPLLNGLFAETGPGPSAPLLNGLFRVALPAGGKETVIWRIPYRIDPAVAIANPDGSGVALRYYFISGDGRVVAGPLKPSLESLAEIAQ